VRKKEDRIERRIKGFIADSLAEAMKIDADALRVYFEVYPRNAAAPTPLSVERAIEIQAKLLELRQQIKRFDDKTLPEGMKVDQLKVFNQVLEELSLASDAIETCLEEIYRQYERLMYEEQR
jgi:hypothetical protein